MRRFLSILIASLVIISAFSFVSAKEELPDSYDDSYFESICTAGKLTGRDKDACSLYRDDLNQQAIDLKEFISYQKSQLELMNQQFDALSKEIEVYQSQINEVEDKVALIQKDINKIDDKIKYIEQTIDQANKKIEEVESQLQFDYSLYLNTSLTNNGKYLNSNNLINIDFKESLIYFLEIRKSNLPTIEQIYSLNKEKQPFIDQQKQLRKSISDVVDLFLETEWLATDLRFKQNLLKNTIKENEAQFTTLTKKVNIISYNIGGLIPSNGWTLPLKDRFTVFANMYYAADWYHGAIDLAAPLGTPVYASANGYVVLSLGGCPVIGEYGDMCNNGFGNYVRYIVQIGDHCYSVENHHFSDIAVNVGDIVFAGETLIGYIGSSGSSTGFHLHLSVIDIGVISLEDAIKWHAKSPYFGLITKPENACSIKGSTPCTLNPEELFKIRSGQIITPK